MMHHCVVRPGDDRRRKEEKKTKKTAFLRAKTFIKELSENRSTNFTYNTKQTFFLIFIHKSD